MTPPRADGREVERQGQGGRFQVVKEAGEARCQAPIWGRVHAMTTAMSVRKRCGRRARWQEMELRDDGKLHVKHALCKTHAKVVGESLWWD